jgi:hypothetical protein
MNAQTKTKLSHIESFIGTLQAKLIYEKDSAQIQRLQFQIANLQARYEQVKLGA